MGLYHRVTFLELYLLSFDSFGELKFLYEGEPYKVPKLGLRPSEAISILIAKAHDAEGRHDEDSRGWIHGDNYPKVFRGLYEVDYASGQACSEVLKKEALSLRKALAKAVFGAYEGEAKVWAKSLVKYQSSRGYRLELPPESLRLTIERPRRRIP